MNRIARNVGSLLVSQFATWALAAVVLIVAPRHLGPDAFGELSFAGVYVSFFGLLALLGTGTYLVKAIARDTDTAGPYVFNTVVWQAGWSTLLALAALGLGLVLGYSHQTMVLIAAFATGMVLNAMTSPLVAGLQGLQRMGPPALWYLIRSTVAAVCALTVLFLGGGVVLYALVFNLANVVPLVALLPYLWSHLQENRSVSPRMWREVVVGGSPFFVTSALVLVAGTIDVPILHALTDDATVGWYSVAYQWVSMPALFAVAVATAFLPALSAEGKEVSEAFITMANRALRLVVLVAAPAAIGLALVAAGMLELFYGGRFAESVPLIRILAIQVPIIGIDIVLGSVLVAADRQRAMVIVGLIAVVFNPLVNLAAVPAAVRLFDNGAIGAASVTVLTEVVVLTGFLIARPRGVFDRATLGQMARATVAAAAMVPVLLALWWTPVLLRVVVGAAVYAGAALAVRAVRVDEVRSWVSSLMSRQAPVAPLSTGAPFSEGAGVP